MNQTFDIHRFALLLRLDFAEKGKTYLLIAALFLSIMSLMMLPILFSVEHNGNYIFLHALALFMVVMFGGSLYTSTALSQYTASDTGISALMIPASQLEKFLIPLLINLSFTIPVAVFFIKFHYWSIEYANEHLTKDTYAYHPIPDEILRYFMYLHMVIQGAAFLGSIYFKKLAYIKTAGLVLLVVITLVAVNLMLIFQYTGDPSKVVAFPFGGWQIWYSKANNYYNLSYAESVKPIIYTFPILFLLGTWFISFVRLKEREI
jgi:hypothetical protein